MNIGIKIVERKPIVEGSPRLVCGNKGDTITFYFDFEWSNYTAKVARFVYVKNGVVDFEEVVFNGNVAEIPVLSNITEVFIGVYAGDLRTTTPVTVPCDFSILCKGGEPVDPTPDIYAQILDALNAKLILEGNASSATKLETPRTIQVDLANSNGASFNGTENVTPGVTGVLPIEKGGTGATTPEGVRNNLDLDNLYAPISLYTNHIVGKATGNAITIDSSKAPLHDLKLFGRTTQDGTPTPENPIPLVSVGDSGSFNIELYGKNLISYPYHSGASYTSNGVTFTADENGIVTVNGTSTGVINYNLMMYKNVVANEDLYLTNICTDKNIALVCYYKVDGVGTWTGFKIPKGAIWLTCYLEIKSGVTINNATVKPMVSVGKKATDFEPYNKEVTSPFNYTLHGIGDIKDEINFNGEMYDYIYKGTYIQRIGVVDLGTLNYQFGSTGKDLYSYELRDKALLPVTNDETPVILCSNYSVVTRDGFNQYKNGTCCLTPSGNITFYNSNYTNVTEFKNDMSGVMLYYALAEPIETPIDILDFEIFRTIRTNKGATTILSEADMELSYYLNNDDAQAIGNVHELLDYNYWTLKRAIISLGGDI